MSICRRNVARHHDGRIVVLLERGYDPKRLKDGAVAVIRGLAGLDAP